MAFLGQNDLNNLPKGTIVPFDPNRIKGVSYELGLGREAYLTNSVTGKKEVLKGDNNMIEIAPGQLALLLTEEDIVVPEEYIAFISIKTGQKFKGLVNISGFHVDPGFSGKLLFSVYNAGPKSIVLERGMPYFMIWFSELKSPGSYNGVHSDQRNIRAEYVENLKGELPTPNVLREQIKQYGLAIEKSDLRRENNLSRIKWVGGILIGLLITLNLAFWLSYDRQYDKGYREGLMEGKIDQTLRTYIDDLMSKKLKESFIARPDQATLIKNTLVTPSDTITSDTIK